MPKKSSRKSSKRGGKKSYRKKSSKRGGKKSSRKSSKRGGKKSYRKKSSKRGGKKSYRKKSSKRGSKKDIISKLYNIVKKYIKSGYPQDTIKSIIKIEYEKGQPKWLSEDIYDGLTIAYPDIFYRTDISEKDFKYHEEIEKAVK
jgi:hypothetical protein